MLLGTPELLLPDQTRLKEVGPCSNPRALVVNLRCCCYYYYTLNHKKRGILFLTITLANLNKFL